MYEYEDIRDPDLVSQGDVIEWIAPYAQRPWQVFGVIITADCDLAWNKHGGVISYVPGLLTSDFIWHSFRSKFFEARHTQALQNAAKLINIQRQKNGAVGGEVSTPAVANWLERAGVLGLINELGEMAPRETAKLREVLDQISVYSTLLSHVHPDFELLERAFAAADAKADRPALIKRIQEAWSQLPGDVFHLPSLPMSEDDGMFLMLRHIRQIPADAVAHRPTDLGSGLARVKRVAAVAAPYRYAITQNLTRVFSDIGLPDEHDNRRKTSAQRFFDTRS